MQVMNKSQNTMLNNRTQTEKHIYYMIPFTGNSKTAKTNL